MRALLAVVGGLVVAIVAFVLAESGGDAGDPDPTQVPGETREKGPKRPAKSATGSVRDRQIDPNQAAGTNPEPRVDEDPPENEGDAPTSEEPETVAGGALPDNLDVLVSDAFTGAPLANFTAIFIPTGIQGRRVRMEGKDGAAVLGVPDDTPGQLRIEATGYVPSERPITVPANTIPMWRENVFLESSAPFSGVELTTRDDQLEPLVHLAVAAWRVQGPSSEPEGRALWSRRGDSPTGKYRLPELEPGHYFLQLRAVEEGGSPRPLLTEERHIHYRGGELLPIDLTFRPGGLLEVTVVDGAGNVRGDEARLRYMKGELVYSGEWIGGENRSVIQVGRVPTKGPALLRYALEPGSYRVQALLKGGEPVTGTAQVFAGQTARTQLILLR